ncbi:MAG TPA: flagellar biosynthesis protein FliQ [Leptospiraceae bacterium]|nr:flagellar biosynthesis protein FliQ [Leptospirales bacterium]HMU85160.1 flagellar biosynthesis protein FliQ [Leptospiraceae bacterium]HMW58182.1 flagellar biosynthesis protein FliQ [Leptospiraceae bacterium]HMX55751.1 flagellar biosynthesis protein FliQ [Leptospiraceae bacterium]HMZ35132.1 flagellar biosynthesis protein FliQ [Leptospiraceae bacterium]
MLEADAIKLIQDALVVTLKVSAPMLILSLFVGLVVSILQTTTSIQEQTLTFVPKLLAVFAALSLFASYIIQTLVDYTKDVFGLIQRF